MGKRLEGEVFSEYRDRQKVENGLVAARSRGLRTLWDSSKAKTFVVAKHGVIGDVYQTGSQKRAARRIEKQVEVTA